MYLRKMQTNKSRLFEGTPSSGGFYHDSTNSLAALESLIPLITEQSQTYSFTGLDDSRSNPGSSLSSVLYSPRIACAYVHCPRKDAGILVTDC